LRSWEFQLRRSLIEEIFLTTPCEDELFLTSLLLSSYLCRIKRKNSSCSACGHPLQDLSHLLLDCPATKPFRRAIFGTLSSISDLWSRPWGVARLLVSIRQKGSSSTTTTKVFGLTRNGIESECSTSLADTKTAQLTDQFKLYREHQQSTYNFEAILMIDVNDRHLHKFSSSSKFFHIATYDNVFCTLITNFASLE